VASAAAYCQRSYTGFTLQPYESDIAGMKLQAMSNYISKPPAGPANQQDSRPASALISLPHLSAMPAGQLRPHTARPDVPVFEQKKGERCNSPDNLVERTDRNLVLEEWLNSALERGGSRTLESIANINANNVKASADLESEYDPALNAQSIRDAAGGSILSMAGVDRMSLRHAGIPGSLVERLYRALYVYTIGFHDIMAEITKHTKNQDMPVLSRIWLLFMHLLENYNRSKYQSMLQELNGGYKSNLLQMRTAYQGRLKVSEERGSKLEAELNEENEKTINLEIELKIETTTKNELLVEKKEAVEVATTMTQKMEVLTKENVKCTTNSSSSIAVLTQIQNKNAVLAADNNKLESALNKSQSAVQRLTKEKMEAAVKAAAEIKELADLAHGLGKWKRDMAPQIRRLDEMTHSLAFMEKNKLLLEQQLDMEKGTSKKAKKRGDRLEAQLGETKAALQQLHMDVAVMKADHEEVIGNLQADLNKHKALLEEETNAREAVETARDILEEEKTTLIEDLQQTKEQVDNLKIMKRKLELDKGAAEDQVSQLEKSVEHQEFLMEEKNKLFKIKLEVVMAAEESAENMEELKDEAEAKYEDAARQLFTVKSQYESATEELIELRKEVESMESEKKITQREVRKTEAQLEKVKSQFEKEKQKVKEFKKKLKDGEKQSKKDHARFEKKMAEADAQIGEAAEIKAELVRVLKACDQTYQLLDPRSTGFLATTHYMPSEMERRIQTQTAVVDVGDESSLGEEGVSSSSNLNLVTTTAPAVVAAAAAAAAVAEGKEQTKEKTDGGDENENENEHEVPAPPTEKAQELLQQQWNVHDHELEGINKSEVEEEHSLVINEEEVEHATLRSTLHRIKAQCQPWTSGKLFDMAFKAMTQLGVKHELYMTMIDQRGKSRQMQSEVLVNVGSQSADHIDQVQLAWGAKLQAQVDATNTVEEQAAELRGTIESLRKTAQNDAEQHKCHLAEIATQSGMEKQEWSKIRQELQDEVDALNELTRMAKNDFRDLRTEVSDLRYDGSQMQDEVDHLKGLVKETEEKLSEAIKYGAALRQQADMEAERKNNMKDKSFQAVIRGVERGSQWEPDWERARQASGGPSTASTGTQSEPPVRMSKRESRIGGPSRERAHVLISGGFAHDHDPVAITAGAGMPRVSLKVRGPGMGGAMADYDTNSTASGPGSGAGMTMQALDDDRFRRRSQERMQSRVPQPPALVASSGSARGSSSSSAAASSRGGKRHVNVNINITGNASISGTTVGGTPHHQRASRIHKAQLHAQAEAHVHAQQQQQQQQQHTHNDGTGQQADVPVPIPVPVLASGIPARRNSILPDANQIRRNSHFANSKFGKAAFHPQSSINTKHNSGRNAAYDNDGIGGAALLSQSRYAATEIPD